MPSSRIGRTGTRWAQHSSTRRRSRTGLDPRRPAASDAINWRYRLHRCLQFCCSALLRDTCGLWAYGGSAARSQETSDPKDAQISLHEFLSAASHIVYDKEVGRRLRASPNDCRPFSFARSRKRRLLFLPTHIRP